MLMAEAYDSTNVDSQIHFQDGEKKSSPRIKFQKKYSCQAKDPGSIVVTNHTIFELLTGYKPTDDKRIVKIT
jgi:hypothetical protein